MKAIDFIQSKWLMDEYLAFKKIKTKEYANEYFLKNYEKRKERMRNLYKETKMKNQAIKIKRNTEIKELRSQWFTLQNIADKYNITKESVRLICNK